MIWLFAVLAALTTFVIAAVSVGGTTAGLASRARRSVYDVEEAVAAWRRLREEGARGGSEHDG